MTGPARPNFPASRRRPTLLEPAAPGRSILRPATAILATVTALLTGACGNLETTSGDDAMFEVVDSAGIEVVRNAVPRTPAQPMLSRSESLRIGVREGSPEYELFNVRDVVRGPDGELYAAFQNDGEIRVYGPGGAWRNTFGGQGEGPGEFRFITWLGVVGDTLLAFDPRLYRMTLFDLSGELLDTWQIRKGTATVFPRVRTPDGWLAELDDFQARVPYDIGRSGTDTTRIALIRSVPNEMNTLSAEAPPWSSTEVVLQHPAWTTWGIGQAGGAVFGRRALWDSQEYHAYGPDGRIYVARGSRYEIDVYDATGAHLRRITRVHEPVPITDQLVDRYREEVLAHYDTTSTTGEAGLDLVAALHQQIGLPGPEQLPVLGEIVIGDDGSIWVERPDLVEDPLLLEWTRAGYQPEIWDILDADGRWVGTVEMPTRSTVHVVGSDWAIVTERDELDVQYIVRYDIGG